MTIGKRAKFIQRNWKNPESRFTSTKKRNAKAKKRIPFGAGPCRLAESLSKRNALPGNFIFHIPEIGYGLTIY
jgi:hypothetical protein